MKLEILVSTMNRQSIEELELEKKGIFSNCLIINQITDNNFKLINDEIKEKNIRMMSFKEKGLSRSRNRALENAKGEICLVSDDDVYYEEEYFKNIKDSFEKNNVDIITFQTITPEGELRKKYLNKACKHSIKTITKVSSVEIVFKRQPILDNNIKFDENFGLGAKYKGGEELIFLSDCLKSKLELIYTPLINSKHPIESSGTVLNNLNNINDELFILKGALSKRLFPNFSPLINILLTLKSYKNFRSKYSLLKIYKLISHYTRWNG